MIIHPIKPVYNEESKILILGSFPSVKSRQELFFYGHPQNRFWKVMAAILDKNIPATIDEKQTLLLSSGIALWDVIGSCEVTGSSDSSIKNAVPNDLSQIIRSADIRQIFVNGKTAHRYYNRFQRQALQKEAICLPSTSPANAMWSLERLIAEWCIIKEHL